MLEAILVVLYSNLFSDFLGGGRSGGEMLAGLGPDKQTNYGLVHLGEPIIL